MNIFFSLINCMNICFTLICCEWFMKVLFAPIGCVNVCSALIGCIKAVLAVIVFCYDWFSLL